MAEVKVLFIGAHNDECPYGVGGLSSVLAEGGAVCRFIATSGLWVKPNPSQEEVARWEQEEQTAAKLVGADLRVLFDRNTHLSPDGREAILEVEREILAFMPDIVFIHGYPDNHIEHRISAHLALDAISIAYVHGAKIKEVYAFEAGPDQNGFYFAPDFYIDVTDRMPVLKESMLQFNQPTAQGPELWEEKKIAAEYNGHLAGVGAAEPYRFVKYPNGSDDLLLKQLVGKRFRWRGNAMYPPRAMEYFR